MTLLHKDESMVLFLEASFFTFAVRVLVCAGGSASDHAGCCVKISQKLGTKRDAI